jgi:hypothetical protein
MAIVPTPATWASLEDATSTKFNSGVRDPSHFAIDRPIMGARAAATQSLSDSTWTDITLATEDVDTGQGNSNAGQHSTSSQQARFTAVWAGWHFFGGQVAYASNGTGRRGARWAKNGSAVEGGGCLYQANTSSGINAFAAPWKAIYLNVGDYVTLQGFQSSTGSLNASAASGDINSSMSVMYGSR